VSVAATAGRTACTRRWPKNVSDSSTRRISSAVGGEFAGRGCSYMSGYGDQFPDRPLAASPTLCAGFHEQGQNGFSRKKTSRSPWARSVSNIRLACSWRTDSGSGASPVGSRSAVEVPSARRQPCTRSIPGRRRHSPGVRHRSRSRRRCAQVPPGSYPAQPDLA